MSLLPIDTINAVTESIGLTLKESVSQALLADVEYRMREVIYDARKFMRHSRRSTLSTEDVNHALRVRNVQPLYGYTGNAPTRFKSTIHGSSRIYYLEDQEVDLDQIINAPLPPVPLDVTFTAHWLAIEGVQPAIVQNPTPADIRNAAADSAQSANSASASMSAVADLTSSIANASAPQTAAVISNPDQATVNGEMLVKNVLSKELQMYHDKITESVLSLNAAVQSLAIESLETDPGIQPLLPYFVQFMTQKITKHVRNLKILWAMMRMTRALLNNKNLFIEPYLHQLMPNVITCIVSKRISESPTDDHHALRRFSAELIAYVCRTYSATYPTLQPRVTKTLLRAFLDPTKPNSTHYGAVVGLAGLGNEVVKLLIRPNVMTFAKECLNEANANTESDKKDMEMLSNAIIDALYNHVLFEYKEAERAAFLRNPASARKPTLSELEIEFHSAFGLRLGSVVAGRLHGTIQGSGPNYSTASSLLGDAAEAAFSTEMDMDL
ncbi:hypothetical protein HDU80_004564 [Chytriomyces hyalinus]|nr:hypothetical protein HDU80_004564 [Chytriomyces hyalinus]